MSNVKTSMVTWKQPFHVLIVATLVVALFGTLVLVRDVFAAPMAQTVRSQELAGVLTGGQSAQIWLGLTPETPAQNVRVVASWDRNNPGNNGLGFYVLTAAQTRSVLAGASLGANNLAAGARLSSTSPDNEIGAVFGGTAGPYTIVLYNNSNADANFVINVDNGILSDDSGQVRDNRAAATDEDEEEAAEAEEPAAPAPAAPVAPTPAPAAPAPVVTVETTTTVEAETTSPAVISPSGVVRSPILEGELPEQYDQHYFEFEPDGSNVRVRIVLSFDPQDQPEIARSLNFWVMDEGGFRRFVDPGNRTPAGSLALAAGNSSNSLEANQRFAEFTTSGAGSYVVLVYNNARIAGSYTIEAEGGQFMDDSQQSLTAQRGTGLAPVAVAEGEADATTATTTTATTTAAPAPAAAASTRTGTPGGTYVVRAGDTLSLIARDVLGNMNAWRDICNLNELADCNRIEVGVTLQLPTTAQIGTTTAPATTAAPAATTAPAAPATTTTTTTTPAAPAADADDEDEDEAETEDEADDSSATTGSVNLVAALRAAGNFTTLVEALEAANLTDALVTGGPFTIFAPTDAAFAALPAGAMQQLLNQPTGQLTQILLFHVLPGRVGASDVSDGMQATTQQGKAVRFELEGSDVQINGANVVVADIGATNGVIHAIDAVILPPTD